jgi:hypothetical protein
MQDITVFPSYLSASWGESVPYCGTCQLPKRLANVLNLVLVPSPGRAAAPTVGTVEVDHEEGSNPDPDPNIPAGPRRVSANRVLEAPPAASVAEVVMAPGHDRGRTGFPRATAWERKGSQNKRPRSGQLLNRATPRPPSIQQRK